MTPDQRARVEDLFDRALAQHPSAMGAWLDATAGDDAEVRAEVRSLLEHHSRAGGFLSEPPGFTAEDDPDDDQPLAPGRVLGPYRIIREAGRGGMGRVYVAEDARLGRLVALKAIRAPLTGSAQRERLRSEARAAATLTHPGICTIYALEELEGQLFIAAEFIEGRTLRQEIAGGALGKMPIEGVWQTAQDLAAALAAAHQANISHGDLKPENVMRTYDGRLKILDFGLARGADDLGAIFGGTPAYMAPEQLNGRPSDARADVFAFGVLMYEYASGVHPFQAATPAAITARVLNSDPAPLASLRDDLPPQLANTIERCLRKAATERFPSAVDMVRMLTADDSVPPRRAVATWWRAHQMITIALYGVASIVAWNIKESRGGLTTSAFLIVGISATIAGVFRGHLLFTERMNGGGLPVERRRADPVTLAVDLVIALALVLDGAMMASSAPLAAVLTIATAVGLALARLVLEPSTTAAAFGA